jgi:hypothetical protein
MAGAVCDRVFKGFQSAASLNLLIILDYSLQATWHPATLYICEQKADDTDDANGSLASV